MAVNKVVYDNNTLIDLTSDTVTADKLAQGYTAHDASGAAITGTMSGGGIVLPAEYQRVEWISNANTARIDLGSISANPKGAILDMKFDVVSSSTGIMVSYNENGDPGTWFGILSSGSASVGGGSNFSFNALERRTYEVTFTDQGVTVNADGATISRAGRGNTQQMSLFAALETSSFNCKATLYECKIFVNGGTCKHLIPCYRKADNAIGLYDVVNGTFYTNIGTGTFGKGNDV